jgi:nitrate reductase NapE component
VSTIVSIYMIRVIIDYLQNQTHQTYPSWYSSVLFLVFCLFRMIAISIRGYYDLHVYNYFKYVENAIKAWLYRDVQRFKQWQMKDSKRAAILNILTKDSEAFVNGSW